MAVKLNQHDLEFVLKQIKIAEAHASGIPLNEIRVDENGVYGTEGMLAISQPHLPYGLRTVDGSYNNIIPGRELWGAADQTMPRMFDPHWRNETDGDTFDPDGPTQPAPSITDGNYSSGGETPLTGGSVVDADPRTISNLIVDQSPNNPAALIAALRHAGHEGDLNAKMASVTAPFAVLHILKVANARVDSWQKMFDDVNATIEAAVEAGETPSPALTGLVPMLEGNLLGAQGAAAGALATANAYSLPGVDDDGDPATPTVTITGAQNVLNHVAAELGIEFEADGTSLKIPNVAPDEGLSAPFNGWMTFFGQFFDHGLDLISKGGDGTIYVPLDPDDPLYVPGGFTNFMVLTRATQVAGAGVDGVLGTEDDTQREAVNTTTPFIDQNQTYTSHPSHQVFLREYKLDADGIPVATGRLLDGANGLPTWKDVKEQAREMLGIELTDRDVFNIPLVRTDLYGEFVRDPVTGFAQVIINIGFDGIPNTADDITMSGTPGVPVKLNPADGGTEPIRTSHSFLDDIAHNAVPVLSTTGVLLTDGVPVGEVDPAGNAVQFNPLTGRNTEYDNELLDAHFVTGDGRGNENIGLTAVHHVFHSEHNRQVAVTQLEILKSGELAFINEWLITDLTQAEMDAIPTGGVALATYAQSLNWDGERLFQTARFATEMQYQHLVFEEFGRKVQPLIDVFVFNTQTDIDPAIFAEFAHVVYRFGHSMLTEEISRMFLDAAGNPIVYDENGVASSAVGNLAEWSQDIGLIEAFLNPVEFDQGGTITHDQAAGAIFRGMSLVRGNEIDEFVVDALRTNLLGLPLDLAAINIARGRDTGMPTLNQAREQLYAATNSTFVKPYESWAELAANLKNPASVINFIAAYGTHPTLLALEDGTLDQKRAAATLLVLGGVGAPADRLAFLNSTGAWTAASSGLNDIDLWVGGLAEKKMPFGGMLGSTFNAVFEAQMEMLQDQDRFYYLTRTQGLNLLNELENNAFSKMIAINSDMVGAGADGIRGTEDDIESPYRTGVDSFAKHDYVLNVDLAKQVEADPEHDDEHLNAIGMTKVQRDNLLTDDDETPLNNYIRFIGGEHVVIAGSEGADTIIADYGDDAIWGGGGNDRIEGGAGVDLIIGGAGNDIITDLGDTGDFIKGEDGDDVIANSNGLDILMGGDGKDVFFVGVDATEVFAGEGDDFILGGADHDFLLGNEGSDWMEGGDGFDVLNGDNSELFFNSTILGHDVMFAGENENDFDAESGDDIMVQGESVMRNEGMFGFDWAIHKGNRIAADSDMRIPIFTTVADDILRDRFDQTEALSGWQHNDVLRGDDRGSQEEIETELDMTNHELSWAGVDRIDGLEELLGGLLAPRPTEPGVDLEKAVAFKSGNVLIGGDGNDTFEGRGGDDFIHGDAWLNVRIRITGVGQENTDANEIATVDTLKHVFAAGELDTGGQPIPAAWVGKSLYTLMLERTIVPNQMHIVREIKYDDDISDNVDTAIFAGNRDWYEITEFEDGKVRVARREMEEVDPQIDEGVDTLIGIERIQFSDQTVVLQQSGNHEPVGRLVIDGLPAREGVTLSVSAAGVYDANNPGVVGSGNVGYLNYRWQIERNDGTGDYINIPGSFGTTFTPGDEHTGLRIRVVGTYVDQGGVTETVMSLTTDVVVGTNDEPVGPLLISDMSPTEGQTLTMTVAFNDADGITDAFEEGLIAYQWQWANSPSGPWTDVAGATGLSWTIPTTGSGSSDFGGRYLRAEVIYTDDLANVHTVRSEVTEVVGELINGSNGNNNPLNGSVGGDTINGNDGNDMLNGLVGNDVLNGGDDNDTLNGNEGHDTLDGEGENDNVNGGAGDDTIIYRNGDDDDNIDGGADTDTVRVLGADGNTADSVNVTYNGTTITRVEFTTGDDADIGNVEHISLDLGNGVDTLSYAATAAAVDVNLLTGAATGFSYIRNVENVTGGSGDDTIKGDNLANVLSGGAAGVDTIRGGFGNDTISGGTGNDLLYGEDGDDVINGGVGNDRIDGGAGNDTVTYAGAAVGVIVTLASAATTLAAAMAAGAEDLLVDIENLTGSSQNDTLTGNAGANRIDGGAGADIMTGGAGADTYVIDDVTGTGVQRDQVVELTGGGNDTVEGSVSIDLTAAGLVGQEIENIVLTGGGAINATGNGLDNRITGNSGNNILDGGLGSDTAVMAGLLSNTAFDFSGGELRMTTAGNDILRNIERIEVGGIAFNVVSGNDSNNTLNGTAERDILLGIDGDDTLNGGDGDDLLVGGAGADAMNGGAGNDTYYVDDSSGGSVDTVTEAAAGGTDTVILSASGNYTLGSNVENLVVVGGGTRTLSGNILANDITGGTGNDTINGNDGADTLRGGSGNDDLNGGAGDDILIGGTGDDDLVGGAGIDTAVFAGPASGYSFSFNGSGSTLTIDDIDNSNGDEGDSQLEQMGGANGIERVQFADRTFVINTGTAGDNTIVAPSTEGQIIFGLAGNDEIRGSEGDDIIVGGAGDDSLFGSNLPEGDNATTGATDNDTFIWNVGDGSDAINGGFEGAGGDTFVVNGDGASETYRIYTVDEAIARIAYEDGDVGGDFEAEIVITRQVGGGAEVVIAAMTDIEEIVVNAAGGTNNIQMFGDFSLTSLRPNTITVVGGAGDDTVNISSLLSAHRIVFKTGGGDDVIVGTLRPQDVIELPEGTTIADYEVTIDEGTGQVELVGDNHTIRFSASNGMPRFASDDDWMSEYDDGEFEEDDGEDGDEYEEEEEDDEEDSDDDTPPADDDDHEDEDDDVPSPVGGDDDDDPVVPGGNDNGNVTAPRLLIGTAAADALMGAAMDDTLLGGAAGDILAGEGGNDALRGEDGDDVLSGGDGDDTMSGGAGDDELHGGSGADMLFGNAGSDLIYGDAGDDHIEAGAGDDKSWGGAGNDIVLATAGDGSDQYWGGEGNDTLDYSIATGNLTVDLGNGFMGRGQINGNGATDTVYGFENVIGGSGHDTIMATTAVNVMDGGLGNDTFRFQSVAAVHGDTIYGFSPGDKINFSAIDSNATVDGKQSFSLNAGTTLTAAGQVAVSYDVRDGNEVTLIRGNTDGNPDADFELTLVGRHTLTANDFNGVS
ncbi:calcium-binding protein [Neorhizobium sp. T786]|uniref:peroxidase family protein n=1 Tax=Pseudorhizobium xiangyangii TaxID=2883104 RepID=UPI001D0011B4|nr:peroxidase family protein [Neorhizobium xiangyangii]MCB5204574.1 calcium-binding protein [Neorhizobium xiangyangii]